MKCLNFVFVGLAASLMIGSCNSSPSSKGNKAENSDSIKQSSTQKAVPASKTRILISVKSECQVGA